MNYKDLIEPYLLGELSETEVQAFEKELSVDEDLQKELDLFKMTEVVIDQAVRDNISSQIKSIRAKGEVESKKPLKIRRLIVGLSIAASLAVLVGFFTWTSQNADPLKFAQSQYNQFQPNFSSFRGGEEVDLVQKLLDEGQAEEAERLITSQDQPDMYLLGHAYFLQGKYDLALEAFNKVVTKTGSKVEAAEFYAGLSLFASSQEEKAIKALNDIVAKKGHAYAVPAEKVLASWR